MHIRYTITGNGYPLTLLHGAYIDDRIWERQIESLQSKFRLILVQLPSHGDAPGMPVKEYRVEHFSAEVVAMMNELGIKHSVFIGLSLGSMIAQNIGARYPGRVKGLVLIGNVTSMRLTLLEKLITQVLFPKRLALLVFGSLSTKQFLKLSFFLTWFMRGNKWLGDQPTRQRIREMIAGMKREEIKKVFAAVYTFGKQDLSAGSFPILLVNGEYDSPVIHFHAKRMVKDYPSRAEFIIMNGCGHACNYDDPKGFSALLLSWMDRNNIEGDKVSGTNYTSEYSKSL